MRALLVVSSSWLAGTERHVVDLASALRARGVEAEVACAPGGGGLDATLEGRGVPVHRIELEGPGAGLARRLPRLAALAREFDLLHAHLSQATAAAVAARALVGRPVVETRHFLALAHEARSWPRRLLGRGRRAMLDRMVELTIAPSRAVAATVGGRVVVVPHGVAIPEAAASGSDAARFVTVARLGHDRDHGLVLRAFAAALPDLPGSATLTVVGDGQGWPALETLCGQLGIGNRVRFAGWLDDPLPALRAADVYLATPYRVDLAGGRAPAAEAYGLAALEAMAAGLPVVGSVRGALSEFVQDGRTGRLVEPRPGELARAMVEVATDPGRRRAMAEAGRRRAAEEFSAGRMAERTAEAYRVAVPSPAATRVLRVYHSAVVSAWRERDRELRRRGAQVTLVSPRAWREGGRRVELDPGPDRFVVPARTWGSHPALFAYDPLPLLRLMRRQRFDHVDVHEEPCSLAAAEVRLLRRALQPRSSLLLYSAQNIPKRYPLPFRRFEAAALGQAAGVYVCNRAAGEILQTKGFRGTVGLLPLGVDVQRFAPDGRATDEPPRPLLVGFVGRLTPEKGVEVLLRASAGQRSWDLVVVGDGPARVGLERLVAELDLASQVALVPSLAHRDLPELYRRLDLLAVPSLPTPRWEEQFCRVAVEAMASAVPVLASASGALPEVVGDAGVLVPAGDPRALRDALSELAGDPERRRELGKRGRARAARFSWSSVAEAHYALYEEVRT